MSGELADLDHGLDLALKVSWGDQPGAARADALLAVSKLRPKLDALDAAVLSAFEATDEHAAEGHASAIGWCQHHLRAKGPDVARRRVLARALLAMPRVDALLRQAAITTEHAVALWRLRRRIGADAYDQLEELLVDIALTERFSDFARAIDTIVVRLVPPPEPDDDHGAWASASRTMGGWGKVDAWLDPLAFAELDAELQRLYHHLLDQDRHAFRDQHGRDPKASELRPPRARRAAALALMARRSARYDGDPGPSRYALTVHADADLVEQLLTWLRSNDCDPDQVVITDDTLCELDDGTPIHPRLLLVALLTGTVQGILYDPQGHILRYGRARRLFTPAQADAGRAKYRRCTHTFGCDHTGARLQSDHEVEHEDGVPPLCRTPTVRG